MFNLHVQDLNFESNLSTCIKVDLYFVEKHQKVD